MTVADRRRRDREARRNNILDAAERVFLERGFDDVTVDEIAVEAEVAKGTLYLYFKNKHDLLLAFIHRRRRPILEAFGEAQADAKDGLDLVARLICAQLAWLADDSQDIRRLVLRHMVEGGAEELTPEVEAHHRMIERIIRTYMNAIERGQRDGSIRSELDPMMLTAQIWGGVVGSLVQLQHADKLEQWMGRRVDPSEYRQSLVELIVRSIRTSGLERAPREVEA